MPERVTTGEQRAIVALADMRLAEAAKVADLKAEIARLRWRLDAVRAKAEERQASCEGPMLEFLAGIDSEPPGVVTTYGNTAIIPENLSAPYCVLWEYQR